MQITNCVAENQLIAIEIPTAGTVFISSYSVAINGDLIFFSSNIQPDFVVVVAVALSVCLCCLRWSTASVATASITADILVNLCPAVWKTIRARCKKMYIECGSTRARTTPSRWITAFGLVAYSFCACSSIYITVSLLTLSEWIFFFSIFQLYTFVERRRHGHMACHIATSSQQRTHIKSLQCITV